MNYQKILDEMMEYHSDDEFPGREPLLFCPKCKENNPDSQQFPASFKILNEADVKCYECDNVFHWKELLPFWLAHIKNP